MDYHGRPVRQPEKPPSNDKALISVICGVVSLLGLCSPIIGIVGGIVAIVLSVLAHKNDPLNRQAKTGRILGIIGLIIGLIILTFNQLEYFGVINISSET